MDDYPIESDELLACLMVPVLKYSINYVDFRRIAEWLGCYQYVLPAKRVLNQKLYLAIVAMNPTYSSQSIYSWYCRVNILETNCSQELQERILWKLQNQVVLQEPLTLG